ncbi:hypothetical protein BofuT4_uP121210.1 [Botrytis cinerea T4]|uniref:Uncharacterized protein n=1 Tax=Botryotinia fuckeliana (strain T4) TaxID=999810 RepID=G2YNA4_BOTF4|nr:hypothetical protein BofuT4_uP121210.1 [Botrytis cinerea T4]
MFPLICSIPFHLYLPKLSEDMATLERFVVFWTY